VVATFCHQVARGLEPTIFTDADLTLVHAQDARRRDLEHVAIEAGEAGGHGERARWAAVCA
jgi:hypothetical protein